MASGKCPEAARNEPRQIKNRMHLIIKNYYTIIYIC